MFGSLLYLKKHYSHNSIWEQFTSMIWFNELSLSDYGRSVFSLNWLRGQNELEFSKWGIIISQTLIYLNLVGYKHYGLDIH